MISKNDTAFGEPTADFSAGTSRWRRLFGESRADLVVLMAMAGLTVAGAAGAAITTLWGNVTGDRTLDVRADLGKGISALAPDRFAVVDVTGKLAASDGTYLVWSIGQALQMLAVAAIAVLVLLVLLGAWRGEPFAAANVKRFLIAAGVSMVGQVGAFVSSVAEMNAKMDLDITAGVEISLIWVPVAFVLYALASVFRRGLGLRDDAELTI
jgi:hypothetical protein